jgi:hypothetical protein
MGWTTDKSQLDSKHGQTIFPFSYVQMGSEVLDTKGSFPGVKHLECEADHSPPPSAKVKNKWSHNSTLPYTFMAHTGTTLPLPIVN